MSEDNQRLRAALILIAETHDLAITSNSMCAALMRSIAREALDYYAITQPASDQATKEVEL